MLSEAFLEWEQETKHQALQQGKQEGKQEEGRSLVLRLLIRRVGPLSPDLEDQIQALSLEQLETLAEDLLDFANLDDFMNWLQHHS